MPPNTDTVSLPPSQKVVSEGKSKYDMTEQVTLFEKINENYVPTLKTGSFLYVSKDVSYTEYEDRFQFNIPLFPSTGYTEVDIKANIERNVSDNSLLLEIRGAKKCREDGYYYRNFTVRFPENLDEITCFLSYDSYNGYLTATLDKMKKSRRLEVKIII